ncbi:MAG: hypothetical protein SOT07_00560 [Paludibacteraceae bacterium]|nr:hypothetical protein [Paludibacteraceae bacterium]
MDYLTIYLFDYLTASLSDHFTGGAGVSPADKAQALVVFALHAQAVRFELSAGETPASPV